MNMWCYKFEFNIKFKGEIQEKKTSFNIVAKNFDSAMEELNNWVSNQRLEMINLKCVDDFGVWTVEPK